MWRKKKSNKTGRGTDTAASSVLNSLCSDPHWQQMWCVFFGRHNAHLITHARAHRHSNVGIISIMHTNNCPAVLNQTWREGGGWGADNVGVSGIMTAVGSRRQWWRRFSGLGPKIKVCVWHSRNYPVVVVVCFNWCFAKFTRVHAVSVECSIEESKYFER